jgi:hypothetical protein
MRNAHAVLTGKHDWKGLPGRPKYKPENNIKMELTEQWDMLWT